MELRGDLHLIWQRLVGDEQASPIMPAKLSNYASVRYKESKSTTSS